MLMTRLLLLASFVWSINSFRVRSQHLCTSPEAPCLVVGEAWLLCRDTWTSRPLCDHGTWHRTHVSPCSVSREPLFWQSVYRPVDISGCAREGTVACLLRTSHGPNAMDFCECPTCACGREGHLLFVRIAASVQLWQGHSRQRRQQPVRVVVYGKSGRKNAPGGRLLATDMWRCRSRLVAEWSGYIRKPRPCFSQSLRPCQLASSLVITRNMTAFSHLTCSNTNE
ncbi:hypothetical protein GOODEAATRI_030296 [Goodea atripinnis]|uniref:Secreted protein n=1 Tax=Goodea atripinnis TaxID=208336 RepID=A0ABV0PID8_9TELE